MAKETANFIGTKKELGRHGVVVRKFSLQRHGCYAAASVFFFFFFMVAATGMAAMQPLMGLDPTVSHDIFMPSLWFNGVSLSEVKEKQGGYKRCA